MIQRIVPLQFIFVAIFALIPSSVQANNATQWIGGSNGLWADPLNWTDGVPTASSVVAISFPYTGSLMPIDLGGIQRSAPNSRHRFLKRPAGFCTMSALPPIKPAPATPT
jgi:hypothetical protein